MKATRAWLAPGSARGEDNAPARRILTVQGAMTPRQKIEQLTRSWYGYSVFAAVVSLLSVRATGIVSLAVGLGLSIVIDGIGLILSIAFVTFLGRKLVNRSSATRSFLWLFSGIFGVLGALATLSAAWGFLHEWSLASLAGIGLMAVYTGMNLRSFRVLGETAVKAYFV